eukprot:TRINITY_DN1681_c0_g4_i2.p1 TRINITY_DN1681_c0_g4~~TRINITY_DN1681_c0_g4_i2.p1  ORF type:complete len:829 (-),score=181.06 TRINITY_DN1681_c0_g4_i2:25-2463(-)
MCIRDSWRTAHDFDKYAKTDTDKFMRDNPDRLGDVILAIAEVPTTSVKKNEVIESLVYEHFRKAGLYEPNDFFTAVFDINKAGALAVFLHLFKKYHKEKKSQDNFDNIIRSIYSAKLEGVFSDEKSAQEFFDVTVFNDFFDYKFYSSMEAHNKVQAFSPSGFTFLARYVLDSLLKPIQSINIDFWSHSDILIKMVLLIRNVSEKASFRLVSDMADFTLGMCQLPGSQQSGTKFDSRRMVELISCVFSQLRCQFSPDDELMANLNLYIIFDKIPLEEYKLCLRINISQIFEDVAFNDDTIITIVRNILDCYFSEHVLFLIYSAMETLIANKNIQALRTFFLEIVETGLIEKLEARNLKDLTLDLLESVFLGFAPIIERFQKDTIDKLIRARRVIDNQSKRQQIEDGKEICRRVDLFLEALIKTYENRFPAEISRLSTGLYQARSSRPVIDPSEIEQLIAKYRIEKLSEFAHERYQEVGYRGLRNLGNTCYMNSYVQALFMTSIFREAFLEFFLRENKVQDRRGDENIARALANLFSELKFENRGKSNEGVEPYHLRSLLPEEFSKSREQQDSSEFGIIFLEQLENALKGTENHDLIQKTFLGLTTINIKCRNDHTTSREERFSHLVVNFHSPKKEKNLIEMIKNLLNDEQIDGASCDKCRDKAEVTLEKAINIKEWPESLIITLNRFSFDKKSGRRIKICDNVKILEFFSTLEVQNRSKSQFYVLYAIVLHRGLDCESGHYITIAREIDTERSLNSWIVYDDASVYSVDLRDVNAFWKNDHAETPYLLFFQSIDKLGAEARARITKHYENVKQ